MMKKIFQTKCLHVQQLWEFFLWQCCGSVGRAGGLMIHWCMCVCVCTAFILLCIWLSIHYWLSLGKHFLSRCILRISVRQDKLTAVPALVGGWMIQVPEIQCCWSAGTWRGKKGQKKAQQDGLESHDGLHLLYSSRRLYELQQVFIKNPRQGISVHLSIHGPECWHNSFRLVIQDSKWMAANWPKVFFYIVRKSFQTVQIHCI